MSKDIGIMWCKYEMKFYIVNTAQFYWQWNNEYYITASKNFPMVSVM